MKVIIVGAGVAGLAIGWRLAQAGVEVEIFERGVAGRGASWAAAGMLAPGAELAEGHDAVGAFARRAHAAWPIFAAELERASGIDVGFRMTGSLIVAHDDLRAAALKRIAQSNPSSAEWVEREKLRVREPLISLVLPGALFIPNDADVDNRVLTNALCVALSKLGVVVRENCVVDALVVDQCRVRAIVPSGGTSSCDAVILACGAWMNLLNDLPGLPPVKPAKGQMIAMEPQAREPLPKCLIWNDDVYLVPRGGKVLIGATVEDAGFDTSVTREACLKLAAAATRILPQLVNWRISEMWAGLRPRTPDDAPVLGKTEIEGLYIAGGQFRNGILFAPAVADAISALVLDNINAPELAPFAPGRFNAA